MSPYDEGRLAAASGGDNPYADGTYHHAEWSRGFNSPAGDEPSNDAFDEGRKAAAAGEESGANPYDIATEEGAEKAERWFAGFVSVEEANVAGEPAEQSSTEPQEEDR